MKAATFFSLLSVSILTLTSLSTVHAQIGKSKRTDLHLNLNVDKINGAQMIESLASRRSEFNKTSAKNGFSLSQMPKAEYIFDHNNTVNFSFDGLDFSICNNKVIAIKGFQLSEEVLSQITEKLVYLDKAQFLFSEKANYALLNGEANVAELKTIERRFFSSLKILTTTLKDISSITRKNDNSSIVAVNLSKLPMPNIDMPENTSNTQSLVQRTK